MPTILSDFAKKRLRFFSSFRILWHALD